MPASAAKHTEADLVLNDLTGPDSKLCNLTARHNKKYLFPLQEAQAVIPPIQTSNTGSKQPSFAACPPATPALSACPHRPS